MKPLTVLTFILSILCFFIMNMAFAADAKTIDSSSFVNGPDGDDDYTYEDKPFEKVDRESYLANFNKDDREAAGSDTKVYLNKDESRVLKKAPHKMRPRSEDLELGDNADPMG